jgi:hypothetical protein
VVPCTKVLQVFRQSDPTKYLNTTNICRKLFKMVRHNELKLAKPLYTEPLSYKCNVKLNR